MRFGQPDGAAADLSRQRLFTERTVRLSDDWAGLLAPGSNQSLHLPTAGLFVSIVFRATRELHAVASAEFVPGYSGGTATELHRFPYSPPGTPSPERHPCRLLMLPIALRMSTGGAEDRGKGNRGFGEFDSILGFRVDEAGEIAVVPQHLLEFCQGPGEQHARGTVRPPELIGDFLRRQALNVAESQGCL